jgi:exodeoxyribonuclease V beta subunit
LADPADDSLADAGASDEVDLDPDEEEVFVGDGAPSEATTGVAGVNPMANLMGGTAFGSLVHSVLERVDWQASDLDAALGEATDTCVARRPVELATAPGCESDEPALSGRSLLIAGMRTALESPLGAPFENRRLVDIGPADRLCELDFDLRLGTGGQLPTTRALGQVVGEGLSAGDPFSLWADALSDGSQDLVLGGNLTGSIDLVARVKGADGHPRFVIADYKTNALQPPGQVATAADYLPDRMAAAMVEHDYPLQALLYCVALHRYLRWRLPGYRPDRHLGGTAYLFVRGMDGGASADGVANGVFSWAVPPPVVERLSDLLDGALLGAVA